jgi:hypothetical protein
VSEPAKTPKVHKPLGAGAALFALGLGAYFLAGAYVTFRDAKWPIFMPSQLDALVGLLGSLIEPAGVWVGGAILVVIGVICIAVGVLILAKTTHA